MQNQVVIISVFIGTTAVTLSNTKTISHSQCGRSNGVITLLHDLPKIQDILERQRTFWQKCEPQTRPTQSHSPWAKPPTSRKLDLNFPTKPLTQNCGDCLPHPDRPPTAEIRSFSHHMADDVKKHWKNSARSISWCWRTSSTSPSPTSKYRPNFLSAPLAIYSCVSATLLSSQQPQTWTLCDWGQCCQYFPPFLVWP